MEHGLSKLSVDELQERLSRVADQQSRLARALGLTDALVKSHKQAKNRARPEERFRLDTILANLEARRKRLTDDLDQANREFNQVQRRLENPILFSSPLSSAEDESDSSVVFALVNTS